MPAHVDGTALFSAAEQLEARLNQRLPDILAALSTLTSYPEGYWPNWFAKKMPNVLSYLQIYAYIIGQALPPGVPLREVRMLDYGSGWGLMGMLAKEAGVGSVTYLDLSGDIAEAAEAIARAAGLPHDAYIIGDQAALPPTAFNSVVSSDVIEHVYNPAEVFAGIARACLPGAAVFHHTGANPLNWHQQVTLAKLHRAEEPRIRENRREVIISRGVPEADAARLAERTRGLNADDLEGAIEAFKASGTLPTPDHPTNTCELSGYWLERLMDPYTVADAMRQAGFSATVRQSFWGPGRSGRAARAIKNALNLVSRASLRLGLRATFYYGVAGTRA